jgi:hypothetical protein
MEAHVRQYVNKCQVCKKSKAPTKKYGLLPKTKIHCEQWEIIQLDLFGPWTFYDVDKISHQIQGISIIDIATHWVELCPYTSKLSENIALLVDQNWFARYPRPRLAIFDDGSEFSFEFLELLHRYGVTAKSMTVKNPQTNAFVEQIHLVISSSIREMELHTKAFDDTTINAVLQNVAYR